MTLRRLFILILSHLSIINSYPQAPLFVKTDSLCKLWASETRKNIDSLSSKIQDYAESAENEKYSVSLMCGEKGARTWFINTIHKGNNFNIQLEDDSYIIERYAEREGQYTGQIWLFSRSHKTVLAYEQIPYEWQLKKIARFDFKRIDSLYKRLYEHDFKLHVKLRETICITHITDTSLQVRALPFGNDVLNKIISDINSCEEMKLEKIYKRKDWCAFLSFFIDHMKYATNQHDKGDLLFLGGRLVCIDTRKRISYLKKQELQHDRSKITK